MAKDPAFLFYPGDYLRDTQCLSEKTQVAYDRIMCEHMRNICISQQQLNFFTKKLNEDEKTELLMTLKKVNGGFQIEWVAESICKRKDYSESRRKNKLGKGKNISKTYVKHMENENVNEDEIVNENTNKLIVPEICKTWYEIFPHYAKDKKEDYYAAGTILKFMLEQSSSNLQTEGINDLILLTVKKIAELIKEDKFWCDKPLKSISKNIQEFYNKLKNPQSNGKRVNLREAVQDEFSKRYG